MIQANDRMRISAVVAAFSPQLDLVYRAVVFARTNGQVPLYFVAGTNGGPWGAIKALTASHKVHGGRCYYCQQPVEKGGATIDHVQPKSRGGSDEIQNLVLSCKPCNAAKGNQAIEFYNPGAGKEWLEAVLKQIQQRLDILNPPSSPPPPSPGAAGDP